MAAKATKKRATEMKKKKAARAVFFPGAMTVDELEEELYPKDIFLCVDSRARLLVVCYESFAENASKQGTAESSLSGQLGLMLNGGRHFGILAVQDFKRMPEVDKALHAVLRVVSSIKIVLFVGKQGFKWKTQAEMLAPLDDVNVLHVADVQEEVRRTPAGGFMPPMRPSEYRHFVDSLYHTKFEDSREWPLPIGAELFGRLRKIIKTLEKKAPLTHSIDSFFGVSHHDESSTLTAAPKLGTSGAARAGAAAEEAEGEQWYWE